AVTAPKLPGAPADDKTCAPTASTTGASRDASRTHLPPTHFAIDDYGFLGRPWVAVLQREKMNMLSAVNSEIRMWIDGNEGVTLYNVTLRDDENTTIQGVTSEWASPKDQKAWFADVSGAIAQS
ncbi:hypothetical protein M0805_000271, partial [Coniferiporia weirii]